MSIYLQQFIITDSEDSTITIIRTGAAEKEIPLKTLTDTYRLEN